MESFKHKLQDRDATEQWCGDGWCLWVTRIFQSKSVPEGGWDRRAELPMYLCSGLSSDGDTLVINWSSEPIAHKPVCEPPGFRMQGVLLSGSGKPPWACFWNSCRWHRVLERTPLPYGDPSLETLCSSLFLSCWLFQLISFTWLKFYKRGALPKSLFFQIKGENERIYPK